MIAEREQMLRKIISLEYGLFAAVRSADGRASCQDKPRTFEVMRRAQFSVWSMDSLRSWLKDLRHSIEEGRNIFGDKYAYMMVDADPERNKALQEALPFVPSDKRCLVGRYVDAYLQWMRESSKKYPEFRKHGRPIYAEEASSGETSFESYLTGEALTYSEQTLASLLKDVKEAEEEGRNLQIEIDFYMAKAYGFESPEDYERRTARERV